MTSTLKKAPPPGVGAGGDTYHGNGSVPAGAASSTEGSEEGTPSHIDLQVELPSGHMKIINIEYGKQMMDLLVLLTASNKLSPAGHMIQVYNEETGRPIDYHASQTIGSLNVNTVHVVDKKKEKERIKNQGLSMTFEKTQRLTVNMPKNQRMVSRVNPKASLADIYKMICQEKNIDPYKHELRHPTRPDEALNMASPLEEYHINEIYVVSVSASSNGQSARVVDDRHIETSHVHHIAVPEPSATMPRRKADDVAAASSGYMPGMDGETKKKKGFFSRFSRKKGMSFKPQEASYNAEPGYKVQASRSMSSLHQASAAPVHTPSVRPASSHSSSDISQSHITAKSSVSGAAMPHKPPRKKRPAPPPPTLSPPPAAAATTRLEVKVTTNNIDTSHSRNSSHSSGFDESNMSPLESPGNSSSSHESAKTAKTKTSIDATSIESTEIIHEKMTVVKSRTPSEGGSSASGTLRSNKKRRAPAPPPVPAGASVPSSPVTSMGADDIDDSHPPLPSTPPPPIVGAAEHDDEAFNYDDLPPPAPPSPEPPEPEELRTALVDELKQGPVVHSPVIESTDATATTSAAAAAATETPSTLPRPATFIPPPPPDFPPSPSLSPSPHRTGLYLYNSSVEVSDSTTQVHASARESLYSESSLTSVTSGEVSLADVNDAFDQALLEENGEATHQRGSQLSEVAVFAEKLNELTEKTRSETDKMPGVIDGQLPNDKGSVNDADSDDTSSDAGSVGHYEVNLTDDQEDLDLVLNQPKMDGIVLIKKSVIAEEIPSPEEDIQPFTTVKNIDVDEIPHSPLSTVSEAKLSSSAQHPIHQAPSYGLDGGEEIMIDHSEIVYVDPNESRFDVTKEETKDSFYNETEDISHIEAEEKEEKVLANDYRVAKYQKEEIVDFQYGGRQPEVKKQIQPMNLEPEQQVTSLRQLYRKPQRSVEQQYRAELSIVERKIDPKPTPYGIITSSDDLDDRVSSSSYNVESSTGNIALIADKQDSSLEMKPVEEISLQSGSDREISQRKDSVDSYKVYMNNNNEEKVGYSSEVNTYNMYGQEVTDGGSPEVSIHQPVMKPRTHVYSRTRSEPSQFAVTQAVDDYNSAQKSEALREETRRLSSLVGPQGFVKHKSVDAFAHPTAAENESILEEKSITMMTMPVERKSILKNSGKPAVGMSSSHADISSVGTLEVAEQAGPGVQRRSSLKGTESEQGESLESQEQRKRSLQDQYEELQRQFSRWQDQLMQNQALLSQKNIAPIEDGEKLEAMQRQMAQFSNQAPPPPPIPPPTPPIAYEASAPTSPPPPPVFADPPPGARKKWAPVVTHFDKPAVTKKPDARWEPPPSTSGARFSTDDLLSAKARLRSNGSTSEFSADDSPREGSPSGNQMPTRTLEKSISLDTSLQHNTSNSFSVSYGGPKTSTPVVRQQSQPSKVRQKPRFEPELDPREELMIAIRNAGGRNILRKVPVKQTKWHYGGPAP